MPKQSDVSYDVWVQPQRGKPVKTGKTVGLPLPGTFRYEGTVYHFAYLDVTNGYIVFNAIKPQAP